MTTLVSIFHGQNDETSFEYRKNIEVQSCDFHLYDDPEHLSCYLPSDS